ncbi:hypothetical protein [Dolosicoccus paucivorans]|uniref:HNH endonuclease n=1 Tax=Dolosicoccus paucivorans TaxID=84521 RepID=A0A1G8MXL7_9LACT|nr:hypothetical protein [Dolosicoccus paucivorans]PMB83583.1 HNH endonuclease [Dolosicoccus paucivorans]PMC57166.1 HNH endonuclease [Dolosicoccus paucivorans]SDI72712.1 5-methylcytosine-specific restriction enzyme A [Dolosicoccus paucivorans]
MTQTVKDLKVGTVLNNKEITEIFRCQFEGGIRKSKTLNLLVLVNDPKYGLYDNRWEGDTLYFTAIGRKGDQTLDAPWQNRELAHYKDNGQSLYLFEKLKPSHYEYKGEVEVDGKPFKETQKDSEGDKRTVYVFPIKLK